MGDSLQEQLIKAGLISTQRADKLNQQPKKQPKQKKAARQINKKPALDPTIMAQQEKKAAQDKALNAAKEQQAAQKALKAEIRDLVLAHQIKIENGTETYYFQHINRAKRILVTKEQHEQLSKGLLAISVLDKNNYLLPIEIGKKILERAPQYAIYVASQEERPNENDPYANFQVPDDLRW